MINLLFVGDIMPGGVLPYKNEFLSRQVKIFLRHYDLRIGTLEAAVGDGLPFDKNKMEHRMNVIHCRPIDLYRLKELDINIVSLANNHIFDMGTEGLESTFNSLDNLGISYLGAGKNLQDASKPVVLSLHGYTIALFAYCQCNIDFMGQVPIATDTTPGVNPLNIENCEEDIRRAKKKFDFVFVLPHWGKEYEHFPLPEIVNYSKRMIDAGADGVFGSHTHQIQPLVLYHGKPIAYSMGNFLFPDFFMKPPRPIWYPPKDMNTSHFDRFEYYPGFITKPCIQVWRPVSRYGMMIHCSISDSKQIDAKFELLNLNRQNIMEIGDDSLNLKKRLNWMGIVLQMPYYSVIRKCYYSRKNLVRRGYHFLKYHLSYRH